MEYEHNKESPKTISEVVIGLMTGTIAIGILCVLYILVKLYLNCKLIINMHFLKKSIIFLALIIKRDIVLNHINFF